MLVFISLFSFALSRAEESIPDYSFLKELDRQPRPWVPESTPGNIEAEGEILETDLRPFYDEFAADGHVSFYVGYGNEGFYPERGEQILEMLKLMSTRSGMRLVDWNLRQNANGAYFSFKDASSGITYSVTVEGERNGYMRAFSRHEVVLYHGHSRYGRGPAFGMFENVYRMSDAHPSIEVDARNPYFRSEPILKRRKHPVRWMDWYGERLLYQYRTQKSLESELGRGAYVKNIPGRDVDLTTTSFLPGRQIFYFYSCKNRNYWRDPIRKKFPDRSQKAVFGTYKDGYGATRPEAVMIMTVVKRVSTSREVVRHLNATRDCNDCFTTY